MALPSKLSFPVVHKHQTKHNDCRYACIQMLASTKAGHKVKPQGADAAYLHGGFGGHRLNAVGNHIDGIKLANGLIDLTKTVDFSDVTEVAKVVATYGPLMVGGNFGTVLSVPVIQVAIGRSFGHWIVVSGWDFPNNSLSIHDPLLWAGTSMSYAGFDRLAWGTGVPDSILAKQSQQAGLIRARCQRLYR